MPSKADTFCIGVQCFLISNNSLLLGLRTAGFGAGTWGLPGGHLEKGETIFQTATRELFEETGIVTNESFLEILTIGDPIP
ncbi:MAG: Phosphatase NudJ, partial [Chloroflexota bacterium]